MIDTRLPQQPKKIIIPLYKSEKSNNHKQNNEFKYQNYKNFWENPSILCAQSATEAFLYILNNLTEIPCIIGIPAFFCPHFAYECLCAGHKLIFYELSKEMSLTYDSYKFLKIHKVTVIIWPNLFYHRIRSIQLIDEILNDNIYLFLDNAQTFPYEEVLTKKHNRLFTLFSFGRSKPLSYKCGGGVFCHGIEVIKKYKKSNTTKEETRFFTDLYQLLEWKYSKTIIKTYNEIFNLNHECEVSISENWEKLKQSIQKKEEIWELFLRFFPQYLLTHQKNVPTIFTFFVKDRFLLSKKLANHGIQTTWYYFPLPLLTLFRTVPCQNLSNTLQFSAKIIIMPWSIHHTNQEMLYVLKVLKQI